MKIVRPNLCYFLVVYTLLSSCIEPFEFESKNERAAFIIEGFISDISSNEHKSMFYEPRYFSVKLKYSGSVENSLDEKISEAEVELISDLNEHWDYTEESNDPGVYYLYYPAFETQPDVKYKINIKLKNGEEYESEYDQVSSEDIRGEINQEETTKLQYAIVNHETKISTLDGLNVNLHMPEINDNSFSYFRWDFGVTWVLPAEFTPPSDPNGVCWVTDRLYYDDYVLTEQKGASPNKNLFFFQTSESREAKFGFSARIRQQEISQKHYQFWSDLNNQKNQSDLFAPPPYNIYSNTTAVNNENEVYGFFGVVNEEYYTWYYDENSLSYVPFFIENCFVPPNFEPAPWCANCLGYAAPPYGGLTKGEEITNEKPKWWTF